MENSPPGIQAMPDGVSAGDGALLGTVGRKGDALCPAEASILDIGPGVDAVEE